MELCEGMFANHIRSPFLLGVLVDMYQEKGDHAHLKKAIEVSQFHMVYWSGRG